MFSPQYNKQLFELTRNKYNTLTKEEIYILNEKLQELSTVEFGWKEYHRRTSLKDTTHLQFNKEFKNFKNSIESLIYPFKKNTINQRFERKFFPFKIGHFSKCLLHYLQINLKYNNFNHFNNNTPKQLGNIVVEHLNTPRIFNDLTRSSIKKAHEKLLNYNEKMKYKDDVLSIERSMLIHDFYRVFAIEIFCSFINYLENNNKIDTDVANIISRDVQKSIFYKGLLINIKAKYPQEYSYFSDITNSILNSFISSGFFQDKINSSKKNKKKQVKTQTNLILPDKLTVTVQRPFKFPSIVKPEKIVKEDVDYLIKPLIKGKCDLTKTDYLVKALNISRTKPYKVNVLFLKLCNKFLHGFSYNNYLKKWLSTSNIDIGCPNIDSITHQRNEIDKLNWVKTFETVQLHIVNSIVVQFSQINNTAINFSNILGCCYISDAICLGYSKIQQLETDYQSKTVSLSFTNSRLFLATCLESFPIYITDILCIRLRKYPREHWLSRTSGQLKHILENYKSKKLTLKGFVNLLKAYYQADNTLLEKFELYSSTKVSKKTGMSKLTQFFQNNPLDFTVVKKPMYFLNIHLAIIKAINNKYRTPVNIEVDQNASALVILSLVLRSKKMAESSNVIGGKYKVSPYDYIKGKVKEFFENHKKEFETKQIKYENNLDVLSFIENSRDLHKYAIMCFCYNQTTMGRIEDFTEEWVNEYRYNPNRRQKEFLNRFASFYVDFVEFVYPNTRRKLEILKEVVQITCKEAPKLSLRTLDGEVINWAFYETKTGKRKFYDVTDRKHKSYSIDVLKKKPTINIEKYINKTTEENTITEFPEDLVLDSRGMKRRLLSYLIHSIDASILRRIIVKMKEEHKTSVNHLHDCVILHPNDLDYLYKVIKDIYSKPDIYNIIDHGVFEQISSNLSPEGKEKLNVLKKEFLTLSDDFVLDLKKINPHHMYSLED